MRVAWPPFLFKVCDYSFCMFRQGGQKDNDLSSPAFLVFMGGFSKSTHGEIAGRTIFIISSSIRASSANK